MEPRIAHLLRKSANKLYTLYVETQELLAEYSTATNSASRVEQPQPSSPTRQVRCIKIENTPRRRKLIKKKEGSKTKTECVVEHIDEPPHVKDEELKQEDIKAEDSSAQNDNSHNDSFDSSRIVKEEQERDTKEEYSPHAATSGAGRAYGPLYGRPTDAPYNAVEFVDLQ